MPHDKLGMKTLSGWDCRNCSDGSEQQGSTCDTPRPTPADPAAPGGSTVSARVASWRQPDWPTSG